jgi:hypothetical protein
MPAYGVHERTGVDLEQLLSVLREDGWPVYVLDGAPNDKDSFFAAVRDALPLDPPLTGPKGSWDAMSDSLWEGLDHLYVDRVAIVWPEADRLRVDDPPSYEVVIEIFTDLVFSLADLKFTVDHVTRLLVLLA